MAVISGGVRRDYFCRTRRRLLVVRSLLCVSLPRGGTVALGITGPAARIEVLIWPGGWVSVLVSAGRCVERHGA